MRSCPSYRLLLANSLLASRSYAVIALPQEHTPGFHTFITGEPSSALAVWSSSAFLVAEYATGQWMYSFVPFAAHNFINCFLAHRCVSFAPLLLKGDTTMSQEAIDEVV